MRTSKLLKSAASVAALAGLLVVSAAGCGDDDDAADDTTAPASTEAVTTTEDTATTTEDVATTTEQTTTVAADEIDVSDFEGSWEATSYAITSKADPAVTIDVIAAGAVLTAQTDTAGNLSGQVDVPEALGGPLTLDFAATFVLVDQETMAVTFDPEIPPLLTDFTGPFGLDETTMTLQDDDAVFDFGDGAGEVPATAEVVLVRI
jgi:hypothetical protein